MNGSAQNLEERLRAAYQAAAETIAPESLPGLGERVVRIARPRGQRDETGHRGGARRRFLLPAAAAAAVVAAAVAVPAIQSGLFASPHGKPAADPVLGPVIRPPAARKPSQRARYLPLTSDGIPAFYVQLGTATAGQVLDVYSTATGKALDQVPLPAKDGTFAQLAPMSDALTYVVAAGGDGCGTTLYELRLTATGGLGSITPAVSLPTEDLFSLTAAANGKSVAYSGQYCNNPGHDSGDIGYVNLATGAITRWIAPKQQDIGSVSLSADGGELGYAVGATALYQPEVAVLATSSPAGQLTSVSQVVASGDLGSAVPGIRLGTVPDAVALAADGQTDYICGGGVWIDNTYSTAPVPVLHYVNGTPTVIARLSRSGNCFVELDPTGRFLLASTQTAAENQQYGLQVIDLATGKVTTVPTPPSDDTYGVTW